MKSGIEGEFGGSSEPPAELTEIAELAPPFGGNCTRRFPPFFD